MNGRRDSEGPRGGEGFHKKAKIKTISIIKSREKENKRIGYRVQEVCVFEGEGVEEGGGGQWMGQEGVSTSTPCPLLGVQTVQQGFEHIRSQGGTRRRVVRECSQQLSS